jgi:hypothetical protein
MPSKSEVGWISNCYLLDERITEVLIVIPNGYSFSIERRYAVHKLKKTGKFFSNFKNNGVSYV